MFLSFTPHKMVGSLYHIIYSLCISGLWHLKSNCTPCLSFHSPAVMLVRAMQLSPGFLVLAFALFHSAAQATVVEDFNHVEGCKNSWYMGTPPWGIINDKLKKICQRYADKLHFVTLYDPQKRIPVYSAYSIKTEGERRVDYSWMHEPQVSQNHYCCFCKSTPQMWCYNFMFSYRKMFVISSPYSTETGVELLQQLNVWKKPSLNTVASFPLYQNSG